MPRSDGSDPMQNETKTASSGKTQLVPLRGKSPSKVADAINRAASPDDSGQAPGGSSARWWGGTAVGMVVSLPVGWVLCYAALLPFFLGLFFFALFGLVIGAVVHRVASGGRPYKRSILLGGTVLLVVVGWTLSVMFESRHVPISMAKKAALKTRDLGGRTTVEFHAHVAGQIREHFREHYPPGGTIGYIRWVLSSGEIAKGEIDGVHSMMREAQRKLWWFVRVVLSIGLFAFGVASQTMLLHLPKDPAAVRATPSD